MVCVSRGELAAQDWCSSPGVENFASTGKVQRWNSTDLSLMDEAALVAAI